MKELALKVFRQPPDRLNCAQSVLYAWREVFGETAITGADLKPFGAGQGQTSDTRLDRTHLPMPTTVRPSLLTYDAKNPDSKFSPSCSVTCPT